MTISTDVAIAHVSSKIARLRPYAVAIVLVVVAIGIAAVFRRLPHADLPLLFLMVVLIIAARWGLWPSILASVLSFLALNFFFTAPLFTFAVEEEGDFATLLFFLAMAGLTGKLAARMRIEMANSRAALAHVSALLDFSRRMAGAPSSDLALGTLVNRLATLFRARALALLPNEDGVPAVRASANGALGDRSRQEGRGVDVGPFIEAWSRIAEGGRAHVPGWTALRLATAGGPVGLVVVESARDSIAQMELAEGLCDQASVAVERTLLVDSLKAAQLESEAERLRSALLSSVSHDLRTPLASIIGSTTSVLEYGDAMNADNRRELLKTILEESQRLDRYIQNLLDMTRFGQRPLEVRREWVDLNDLIAAATDRLESELADRRLCVHVTSDVALIKVHGALMEQVIVNLLDNAARFSAPGSEVIIDARVDGETAVIDVVNEGPGIPEREREKVFDMFYRASQGDRQRSGTGLGLAICRSIINAHGGSIRVESSNGRTCLRIRLPIQDNPTERVGHAADPDHRG